MECFDVLIVGAGISGIGMGCHLRLKTPEARFCILEGRTQIGGTWDLFRYPGIRSDSDMYTFGYGFRPWTDQRDIASGDAIRQYLEDTVDEYGLRENIRFGHRVEAVSWSSDSGRWVIRGEQAAKRAPFEVSGRFVVFCTGYYDYAHGYTPAFSGQAAFQGRVVHPQQWPEDLDYTGRRVAVIGSGATAVTLVPAMAEKAGHVTMVQRTPSFVVSRPAKDARALWFRRWFPPRLAYRLIRWTNIAYYWSMYRLAQLRPKAVRERLLRMAAESLGSSVDVNVHFNPPYGPWDQRLCLVPDGDLFEALRSGRATIVTDAIERFVPEGLRLASGKTIEADIIVTATGLELQFIGGAALEIDGRPLSPTELVTYRGVMFQNVPNLAVMYGYSAMSWTLKVDLAADYICRVLKAMARRGAAVVTPTGAQPAHETEAITARLASAGYVKRGQDRVPRQGRAAPWRNLDDFFGDYLSLKWSRLDDGVLRFETRSSTSRSLDVVGELPQGQVHRP